ncbi:MAG: LLM class flavin-dependent oxidoreductase [Pseudomonadales bacterium]
MEYFPNFPAGGPLAADEWARAKEDEGWHGICASDHFWVGNTRYPHVFVAATQMACATTTTRITTSFCNNLFRSPVEFAQAAWSLQMASNGRFEAGLGAGWAQDEIEAIGHDYPPAGERVSRYVEALKVVQQLLVDGQCSFNGDYYQVQIEGDNALAVGPTPPPLIGSAGGPRALREVTPLVDRIEIKASARATRVGHLDFDIMRTVTREEVLANVERVKAVRADVPIGIFLLVGVGESAAVSGLKDMLGDSYLADFVGPADTVSQALAELADWGIDRVQLTELVPGSHSELAPELLT